jgi:hypothetical protein
MYTTFLGFVQVQPYNALYGSLSDLYFGLGRVCVCLIGSALRNLVSYFVF